VKKKTGILETPRRRTKETEERTRLALLALRVALVETSQPYQKPSAELIALLNKNNRRKR